MEIIRCSWCIGDRKYEEYHDNEWGIPSYDDKVLFEYLVLEGAQAGLNWLTILKKREGYRKAFYDFEVDKVSQMRDEDVERLMHNEGIIRHKLKIFSVINNAQKFIEIQNEFGSFSNFIWGFLPNKSPIGHNFKFGPIPAKTSLSEKIAKEMKKRGFKFFGATTCYAYMQAIGMTNDHHPSCFLFGRQLV